MLIDLSEVLSEPHKSIDEVVGTEMKEVKVSGSRFPVSRTQPVHSMPAKKNFISVVRQVLR